MALFILCTGDGDAAQLPEVAVADDYRARRSGAMSFMSFPSVNRNGHCFTDFWAIYLAVIPEEQHTAVGKETGETAHIKRCHRPFLLLGFFVHTLLKFLPVHRIVWTINIRIAFPSQDFVIM